MTTTADAGVAARRALAIQRDESRVDTAEAKSLLQDVSHQLSEEKGKLNLEQDLRHESDAGLA